MIPVYRIFIYKIGLYKHAVKNIKIKILLLNYSWKFHLMWKTILFETVTVGNRKVSNSYQKSKKGFPVPTS